MQMYSMKMGMNLPSSTLPGSEIVIKSGDCVLIRPEKLRELSYVAKVVAVQSDDDDVSNLRVRIRYYYRREDTERHVRESWKGADEVFLLWHHDTLSVATIESKCRVHTLTEYEKVESIEYEDFFHRADYAAPSGVIDMRSVEVNCICKELYNLDKSMVQCEGCEDAFHPACVGMTIDEAESLEHFYCDDCEWFLQIIEEFEGQNASNYRNQ